jgi:hypothetical protein
MNRNTENEPLAHVAVATRPAATTNTCTRCSQPIKPPYFDSDLDHVPLCWQCRERPCEGYSAFCHECQCAGLIERTTGMCRCGARWSGDRVCHCATCHLSFTSEGPFDFHRTGPWDNRRCLTAAQLRSKGYEPNDKGHWRKPAPEGMTWH